MSYNKNQNAAYGSSDAFSTRSFAGRFIRMCRIFLVPLLLTCLCATATAHIRSNKSFLVRDSIIYNLSGPEPFSSVRVEFRTNGFGIRRKIQNISITVNDYEYVMSANDLGILYYPRLDDLHFSYSSKDARNRVLDRVEFRIPHDHNHYVDCGKNGRVKYLKEIRILIRAYDVPEILEGETPIKLCEIEDGKEYPKDNLFEE